MKLLLTLSALALAAPAAAQTARFDWFDYTGSNPSDAKLKAGEYRNPILGGFYPDPSVTRVGDDFYLVTSTFSYFPGIPVFHSKDLVNWTQIGNAIDRPGQLDFKKLGMSRGVFAPSIQWHDGLFYILNTCVDCGGNFAITAKDPAGPWSAPVWLPTLEGGIDPSLFFDDDGRTWAVYNNNPEGGPTYDGHRAIWVQEMNLRPLQAIGPRVRVVNGGVDISKKPVWIEGPHILKKDGWYYLICAEGGTAEGHSQVALRSRSVTGPYLPNPANPILTQRDLPRGRKLPITSAGHAQLVDTPDGAWWATFLAVRPYEGDYYNTGRETFLMPVTWRNGWPSITAPGQRIPYARARPKLSRQPAAKPPTNGPFHIREEFDGPLPNYWMMARNPRSTWYKLDQGALVLTARSDGLGDYANPSFLARRQQHTNAVATTVVRFDPKREGDRAGLAAFQNDDYWAFVGVGMQDGRRVVTLEARAGEKQRAAGNALRSVPLNAKPDAPVYLRVTARGAKYDFAYALRPAGKWVPLGSVDGRTLSTKTAGGFIGATFGVYAHKGE